MLTLSKKYGNSGKENEVFHRLKYFYSCSDGRRKSLFFRERITEFRSRLGYFYVEPYEIRSVLSKKKGHERDEIEEIQQEIINSVDIIIPDSSDFLEANKIQKDTFAYPMDSIIMALAMNADAELISFDSELIDLGAKTPEEILDN
ncbi:PIN domain-containing protein [Candidatus Nanohalobium constans]|uniref:Twitching motility protein PilT n=1 Tax=Candidatus Nanohalobium constans TaxID=2565781 RepID=A0A5Q0UGB4_9ARCH|nr:PIN domain-containing protein [Candidatus Nanohalobium constans]QGA80624.1 twitching motility protein PilT [Candidatus Nanohalobium constans]